MMSSSTRSGWAESASFSRFAIGGGEHLAAATAKVSARPRNRAGSVFDNQDAASVHGMTPKNVLPCRAGFPLDHAAVGAHDEIDNAQAQAAAAEARARRRSTW